MTQQPPPRPAAMRGAVDLSGLGQGPSGSAGAGAQPGASVPGGVRVEGTDANFQDLILSTREVPALVVLYSASHPETQAAVNNAVAVADELGGRLRVIAVDAPANPVVAQAFQAQQIPMTLGLIAAQPVPLFPGVQPVEQLRPLAEELLKVAAENGVTGRVAAGAGGEEEAEPAVDPQHEAAFDAIDRGDYGAAIEAYEKAIAQNPADDLAKAGLAQVKLMKRTQDVDLQQARDAAAVHPEDVDAQMLVADLDLMGGHVEDAFSRLLDVVRATSGDDRDKARAHLLELFEVVGPHDERVAKARRALMSALF